MQLSMTVFITEEVLVSSLCPILAECLVNLLREYSFNNWLVLRSLDSSPHVSSNMKLPCVGVYKYKFKRRVAIVKNNTSIVSCCVVLCCEPLEGCQNVSIQRRFYYHERSLTASTSL